MKITVRQLKQLIREQVEEISNEELYPEVTELLASVKKLNPRAFFQFQQAMKDQMEDLGPSIEVRKSDALKHTNWKELNRLFGDEIYEKFKEKFHPQEAWRLYQILQQLAYGTKESDDPNDESSRLKKGDTAKVLKALKSFGYKVG